MLKDYKTRVTGNYEILRALLEVMNRDAATLVRLNREADAAVAAAGKRFDPGAKFPLRTAPSKETEPFLYHTFNYTRELSGVSGQVWIRYTPEPLDITIPHPARLETTLAIAPPRAYIVPAQWTAAIEVLEAHGLRLERTTQRLERRRRHLPLHRPEMERAIVRGTSRDVLAAVRCPVFFRTLHAGARDPVLPRRVGGGSHGPARRQGGHGVAGAGSARLRRRLGLFRCRLRAEGVCRGLRGGETGARDDGTRP